MSHSDDARNRPLNPDEIELIDGQYRFVVDGEEHYWIPQDQYQPPRPVRPGDPHSYLPAFVIPYRSPLNPPTHSLNQDHVADVLGYHLATGLVEQDLTEAQTTGRLSFFDVDIKQPGAYRSQINTNLENGIVRNDLLKERVGDFGEREGSDTTLDCINYTTVAHQGVPGTVIGVQNRVVKENAEKCLERLRKANPRLFDLAEEANATLPERGPAERARRNNGDNVIVIQPQGRGGGGRA